MLLSEGLRKLYSLNFRSRLWCGDMVLWVFPAFLFLTFYVSFFDGSRDAFWPHFFVVFLMWLGFYGMRLVVWRFFPCSRSLKKIVAASLFYMPPAVLSFWYVIAILGIASWGRIPTWPLLAVYLSQVNDLITVVGLHALLGLILSFFIVLMLYVAFLLFPTIDGAYQASSLMSLAGLLVISISSLIVSIVFFCSFSSFSDRFPVGPLSIGFAPAPASLHQSHALASSVIVNSLEAEAFTSYRPRQEIQRRNVILIVGDALRSDHIGLYGYGRPTTPFLDASAKKYQTLIAGSTRAVCSESFCGLTAIANSRPLHLFPSKPLTLHEVLRRHGYRIGLILSGDHTNFYGLKESYGAVDSYFDGVHQKARYVNDDLMIVDYVSEMPRFNGKEPVMLQFHLMSTHGLGLKHDSSQIFQPSVNYYSWPVGRSRVAPSEREAVKAVNHYDNGVLQFDSTVQAILSALGEKGYLDSAVVLITGDHGEMLGENKFFGHQYGVDEEVLRVPFILQRRGYSGYAFSDWPLTSQIDIAPTILYELGIEVPKVWSGVALQESVKSRVVYFQQGPRSGLYYSPKKDLLFKYWMNLEDGSQELFEVKGGVSYKADVSELDASMLQELRSKVISASVFAGNKFAPQ